jgi:subtilisin family serine protease
MRVPRRSAPLVLVVLAVVLGATVAARGREGAVTAPPVSWRGLVGGPRAAAPAEQRMIVVLRTPSVAQRLAKVRYATEGQERSWWTSAYAAQKQVIIKLAGLGVTIEPDYSFYLVVDGFSAELDSRAVALLEQLPEVAGIYPVRTAFPASVSEQLLATKAFDGESGRRPAADLPGVDGRGVTIALLDTGVDESHPYLETPAYQKVLPGIDIVGHGEDAVARSDPHDPTQVERHGTELAGILVGSGGPAGLHGVAPRATLLPIRVAGWQPAADGRDLVYARTDQIIAGLDRAVDPNGDGDAHDAARVALLGVSEPYAAFTDGPEAQAVQGALDLNTVVVTPAGNDGAAGPVFGSVAGPAGAPAALAVAATDSRAHMPRVRVVLRRGLDVILDEKLPLLGATAPTHRLILNLATAGRTRGRAAVVPAGEDPEAAALAASRAGAAAVVLYGGAVPPGSLRVTEGETAPVVVVPAPAATELLAAARAGVDVGVAVGTADNDTNGELGTVADFSSRGLAFDGSVKPNVAAPGIGLATAEPGAAADASPLYGTVNGTSAAAASVAGAAALLAQMRPALDGASLESLLVGYAAPNASVTSAGAGTLRVGASAVGEVAAQPTTLGFGVWQGPHWHATRTLVVRNVSTRRLQLSIRAVAGGDSEALKLTVVPSRRALPPGHALRVRVTVRAARAPESRIVTGAVQIAPSGSETLRVPWALEFDDETGSLLGRVAIDRASFPASDTAPAILSVQAGRLVRDHGLQIRPVSRLDILLYSASGRFLGVMARLRNLLPGSYSFGITGRGPTSTLLPPGRYELRLAAWPTLPRPAKPSRAQISFQIE